MVMMKSSSSQIPLLLKEKYYRRQRERVGESPFNENKQIKTSNWRIKIT